MLMLSMWTLDHLRSTSNHLFESSEMVWMTMVMFRSTRNERQGHVDGLSWSTIQSGKFHVFGEIQIIQVEEVKENGSRSPLSCFVDFLTIGNSNARNNHTTTPCLQTLTTKVNWSSSSLHPYCFQLCKVARLVNQ